MMAMEAETEKGKILCQRKSLFLEQNSDFKLQKYHLPSLRPNIIY
jgi:hypothetical protein